MRIRVDPTSGVAPFEQVRQQIADSVRAGALPTGTRLPTVRGLAEDLGLAPNTVAKAYRVLEADGTIETRGRGGTFVAAYGEGSDRRIVEAAAEFAATVRRLGHDPERAVAAVRAALGAPAG